MKHEVCRPRGVRLVALAERLFSQCGPSFGLCEWGGASYCAILCPLCLLHYSSQPEIDIIMLRWRRSPEASLSPMCQRSKQGEWAGGSSFSFLLCFSWSQFGYLRKQDELSKYPSCCSDHGPKWKKERKKKHSIWLQFGWTDGSTVSNPWSSC